MQPPTTEKVMLVFISRDSADFVLIDFRLLEYLWQSRHKFLHRWIENFRQHNHLNHPSGNNSGSPFNSYPFRCDLFAPPIQFSLNFYCSPSFSQFDWALLFVGWRAGAGQWKQSDWRSNWGKSLHLIEFFSLDIVMIILFQTIQVCWRIYLFDAKQLMVSRNQDNWNIISSLLQSTFLHIIDISITTCAHFKLQLFIDPMPVAAGHHASTLCICCCHSAARQRRRLYNASPAVATQFSSGGRCRATPQRPPPRSGAGWMQQFSACCPGSRPKDSET